MLKCSEQVVWSTTWFLGVLARCLAACGHNPNIGPSGVEKNKVDSDANDGQDDVEQDDDEDTDAAEDDKKRTSRNNDWIIRPRKKSEGPGVEMNKVDSDADDGQDDVEEDDDEDADAAEDDKKRTSRNNDWIIRPRKKSEGPSGVEMNKVDSDANDGQDDVEQDDDELEEKLEVGYQIGEDLQEKVWCSLSEFYCSANGIARSFLGRLTTSRLGR